jgi:MFS-type transporter involved in bile tolerance (Atg22 family)
MDVTAYKESGLSDSKTPPQGAPESPLPAESSQEESSSLRGGCCNRPPFEGNKEALGWALDSIATTIAFVGAGAFLAMALIKIAKDEAGCQIEKLPGESKLPDCNEKVYGLKPSSLLSTFATVVGLLAAISMPLMGAIVDYTSHRRGLGRLMASIFCLSLFPTIFVNRQNWVSCVHRLHFQKFMSLEIISRDLSNHCCSHFKNIVRHVTPFRCSGVSCVHRLHFQKFLSFKIASRNLTNLLFTPNIYSLSGWFETMLLYAYLPELTDNEQQLNKFTRRFTVLSFGSTVLYLAGIIGGAAALGYSSDKSSLDDEIGTARLAQSVSFAINSLLLSIAWGRLFQQRPCARTLPPGKSIWIAGFRQVYNTIIKVYRNYPALKWFFVAVCFCDAATHALTVLAITYMTDLLEFSGAENGTAILIMLISSIPGGLLSGYCSARFNPIKSSMMAVTLLMINTALVSIFLKGPDQATGAYILAVPWGIGTGAKWTSDRMLFARIVPGGQNTELSGCYGFSRQVLTWLPPLVFTLLNESDVSLRWALISLDIFFLLGFLSYGCVGSYAAAVAAAHAATPTESRVEQVAVADDESLA